MILFYTFNENKKISNKLGIVIPAIYLCPCRCVNNIGREKIMKVLHHEASEFDFHKAGNIAIINGQDGLHETESKLFKRLADFNFTPIVIDDLFEHPERIQVLKLMGIETIVLGTTGTFHEKIELVMDAFDKMNWLPKHAIFTMGEDYFWKLKDKVKFWSIMPMAWNDSDIIIEAI